MYLIFSGCSHVCTRVVCHTLGLDLFYYRFRSYLLSVLLFELKLFFFFLSMELLASLSRDVLLLAGTG